MDRRFIYTALCYGMLAMLLGIHMAATKQHGQMPTHAHIALVGFVVSFVYALCHKLWLNNATCKLARIQFYTHQIGVVLMAVTLFLKYGLFISADTLEPVLAIASLLILAALIMMSVLFHRSKPT